MLLPHGSLAITISDRRSRRLADDVLEGCADDETLKGGCLAVASISMRHEKSDGSVEGRSVRSVVCVAKVVRRTRLRDGRESLLLAGACRANIVALFPSDDGTPYDRALLEPMADEENPEVDSAVADLCELLGNARMSRVAETHLALRMLRDREIPGSAAIDIAGLMLVRDDAERYQLLALPNARDRARVVYRSLYGMDRLIQRADEQHPEAWPKGMSWN